VWLKSSIAFGYVIETHACSSIAAIALRIDRVETGGNAAAHVDDVREFVKMLKETSAVVEKALQQRKTLEQMKKEKILAPWSKWSGDFVNEDAFIETLYNSLTGSKGEFLKHN